LSNTDHDHEIEINLLFVNLKIKYAMLLIGLLRQKLILFGHDIL